MSSAHKSGSKEPTGLTMDLSKPPTGLQRRLSTTSQLSSGDRKERRKGKYAPTQDTVQDISTRGGVIWDDNIEKLQIKPEDLHQLRTPRPSSAAESVELQAPKTASMVVRKIKPESEWKVPRIKTVTVAKPASPKAEVKPMDLSGFAGARYDRDGCVIPHSILGTYKQYRQEAIRRGDMLDIQDPRADIFPDVMTPKYPKLKRKKPHYLQGLRANESKALYNWQLKMMERKKQQGHISEFLERAPEDLTMNHGDNYRQICEERYIIDRTIPAVDYGKGFRVGSEFWKQQEHFGDTDSGLHMSLTQAERGYPAPIVHIGTPVTTQKEKGWHLVPTHTRPGQRPWTRNTFLDQRKKQLGKYIKELDPFQPEFEGLEVIGTSDPYQRTPQEEESEEQTTGLLEKVDEEEEEKIDFGRPSTYPGPSFGPSLIFAGQPARWTGDSFSFKDQMGIEARVSFECYNGERVTSHLTIANNGTTAVHFTWKKMPKDNPFDLLRPPVQRFYFDNSGGVILPGDTLNFPFVFKTPNAGIFTEQWKIETQPVVMGGAQMLVTLRGIAHREDALERQRQAVEDQLAKRQLEEYLRQWVLNILDKVGDPLRDVQTPLDSYITDEQIFHRLQPKLHYRHATIQELTQMQQELVPEEERDTRVWDLCINDLKDDVSHLDEEDERKENFMHQLNTAVSTMSFKTQLPAQEMMLITGYQFLQDAVDKMVDQSDQIRYVMDLPEKVTEAPVAEAAPVADDTTKKPGLEKSKTQDSAKTATPTKDAKGAKSKEPSKTDLKGKGTPAPSVKGPSRGDTGISQGTLTREGTEAGLVGTKKSYPLGYPVSDDPVEEQKYKEKMYLHVFNILGDMADQMDKVFQDILSRDTKRGQLHL